MLTIYSAAIAFVFCKPWRFYKIGHSSIKKQKQTQNPAVHSVQQPESELRCFTQHLWGFIGETSCTVQSSCVVCLELGLLYVLWSIMAECSLKHHGFITYFVLIFFGSCVFRKFIFVNFLWLLTFICLAVPILNLDPQFINCVLGNF